MQLVVVGGLVEGKVKVKVAPGAPFRDIFLMIEEALGKGPLWDKFQLHTVMMIGRKVKPTAHVIQPEETPDTLGLSARGVVLLQPIRQRVSSHPTESSVDLSSTPLSARGDYRSRLIAIYRKYNSSKLSTVDATLRKFEGKEEAVIRQLVKKYGPEPVDFGGDTTSICAQDALVLSCVPASSPLADEVVDNGVTNSNECNNHFTNKSGSQDAVLEGAHVLTSGTRSKPSNIPVVADTVFLAKDSSDAVSPNDYKFHSPAKQEPFGKPFPVEDENSAQNENRAMWDNRDAKPCVMSIDVRQKGNTTTTAALILNEKSCEETQFVDYVAHIPPKEDSRFTVLLKKEQFSIASSPGLRCLAMRVMTSLRDTAANTLRQAYWRKWQYGVAQRVADKLIGMSVWTERHDGVMFNDDISPPYVVPNLNDYILERRICRRQSVDFSDDLQKSLRKLLYTVKLECLDEMGAEEMLFFTDQELCPVRDTKKLAVALSMITDMIKDLPKVKEQVSSQQREVAMSHEVCTSLRNKLAAAELAVDQLAVSRAQLSDSEERCATLEEKLKRAQEELNGARYKLQFLQRELKSGQRLTSTNTDVLVQQKEVAMISLQQELASVRTKLHREHKEKEALKSKLAETRLEIERTGRQSQAPVPEAYQPLSSVRDRSSGVVGMKLNRPPGAFSSLCHLQTQIARGRMICEDDFEPETKGQKNQTLNNMTNGDLLRENLQLESELQSFHAAVVEVDLGGCPHCMMRLTPCSALTTGSPEGKAAFCFSCRRSFTFSELKTREKYVVSWDTQRC